MSRVGTLKISDFDSATSLSTKQSLMKTSGNEIGTLFWLAPECWRDERAEDAQGIYGYKVTQLMIDHRLKKFIFH
jgi:hypothetical protein